MKRHHGWPVALEQERHLSMWGHPASWQFFTYEGETHPGAPWVAYLVRGSTVFMAVTQYHHDILLPVVAIKDYASNGDAMAARREMVGNHERFEAITFPAWAVSVAGARRPGAE